jgi:hypothetical protein
MFLPKYIIFNNKGVENMPGKYNTKNRKRPIHFYSVSGKKNQIGIVCQETEKAYLLKTFKGTDPESPADYSAKQWYRKSVIKLNQEIGSGYILGDPFSSSHPWKLEINDMVKNQLTDGIPLTSLPKLTGTQLLQELKKQPEELIMVDNETQTLTNTTTFDTPKIKPKGHECPVCGNRETEYKQEINKIYKCSVCSTYFQ